jgi:hypothetical protein
MACSCCEAFAQAPLPSRPINRGRAGPGPLAHVLVGKYCDHLPLYRQSEIYAREKVDLHRSTLTDWVGRSTALLGPLAEHIGKLARAGLTLFADDTPVKMQTGGKTGKAQTARMWRYVRDERPWCGPAPPCAFAMGLGPMAASWLTISSAWIERESIPPRILLTTRALSMPTGSPASTGCSAMGWPASRPAWCMSAASSWMSSNAMDRPSPGKPSNASPGSMPSKRRRGTGRPTNASPCDRPSRSPSSTSWRPG